MKSFALLPSVLLLLACTESVCPPGTMSASGRCIRADAGGMDAALSDASDIDASEPDASQSDANDGCVPRTFWRDADDDGHGDPESPMTACTAPEGHVDVSDDCDDECPTCFDEAAELCDGLDQDCDGEIDEELPTVISYADIDGDMHGDPATEQSGCSVDPNRVEVGDDCDDESPARYPGATEVCNTIDDDCDTRTDEGVLMTTYRDVDGDGYGVSSMTRQACTAAAGYSLADGDCNDDPAMNGAIFFPNAPELCDERDNDCDTRTDEGATTTYYRDCDRDGYAPSATGSYAACRPAAGSPLGCLNGGWTSRAPGTGTTDCHDFDASAFPGNPNWYTTTVGTGTPGALPWDHNCNGLTDRQLGSVADGFCLDVMGRCLGPNGWSGSVPECGEEASYVTCGISGFSCGFRSATRVQECR